MALASVTGTLLVNHYSVRAAAPVVVQSAAAPPGADAIFAALRDEHQLVVDYLKRDVDAAVSAKAEKIAAAAPEPPVRDRLKAQPSSVERSHKTDIRFMTGPKAWPPAEPPAARPDDIVYEDAATARLEPIKTGMFDLVGASFGAVLHLPERALAFRFASEEPAGAARTHP